MDEQRRALLGVGAAALLSQAAAAQSQAAETFPPIPKSFAPGKPGEFDFLSGAWRILHHRLPSGATSWDTFEGEATCWSILGGVCSIEELRIPARNFSGMGLRLLDVEKRVWSDHWVNAKNGVVGVPGVTGGFVNGEGIFASEDKDGETPIIVLGLWDQITATSCRWRQAVSRDEGKSWAPNWIMQWTRV
jgi:hypothetical protein